MPDWIAEEHRYLFQNYGRQPVVIERGSGTRAWDTDGNEYLDFVGGVAVNVLGHSHPAVVRAISEQAARVIHTSNLFYSTPMIELARVLVEASGLDRAFFCNSGTEAVEAAIKLARRWGRDVRDGAFEIITTTDSFHGRTMGSLSATGNARYREPFEPLVPGFRIVPWNDLDAVRAATSSQTAAVMVEPIQGEGGVNMPAPGYLAGLRDWCDRQGILLIFDEVQTGIGRTGTLFAFQHDGVRPDVMALAKGLAGGVPIGAILARDDIAAHFVKGDHGSTFGGNALAAAAALATLREVMAPGFLETARERSQRLIDRLQAIEDRHPLVTGIRGRGMLLAVGLARECSAEVVDEARRRGLLVNNVRPNAVRLMPPLNVSEDDIDRAADILEAAIAAVEGAGAK
ncbi:acetylornithine transaminase [Tepidiforma flava]|uniref:Acetylornithine aminotransferase n=1 Tax=Tepidiforma flava TaxID=3004094 RepID=A0ABY7M7D5_9CHLR|nr:acetylornithine transaminase [Tepidiforma flava]WBL35929.1 acetylornithine transaminase [Tepidiforma flava]